MTDDSIKSTKRILEPINRVSETLFDVIKVLTFTLSPSVAEAGRTDARALLSCHAWWTGAAMVILATILVGICLALGG